MNPEPLYRFPARLELLSVMVARLQASVPQCAGIPLQRAETALEELLTNSIVHGHAPRTPAGSVWLAARGDAQVLHLRYEDACAGFDPVAHIERLLHRTARPLAQRAPGGLGLLIVFRLADGVHYRHEAGHNRIDLRFSSRVLTLPDAGAAGSVDLGA